MKILIEQNLAGRQVAVLILSTNNLAIIQSNAALIAAAVQSIQPAEFIELALPANQ